MRTNTPSAGRPLVFSSASLLKRRREVERGVYVTSMSKLAGQVLCAFILVTNGCALHYYDKHTGTEHVWGLAHMRMKSSPVDDGVGAVVTGVETHGLSLGLGRDGSNVTAGWDNRRRIVVGSNAAVRLEWPNSSFFNVRVGTSPPFVTNFANFKNKNS